MKVKYIVICIVFLLGGLAIGYYIPRELVPVNYDTVDSLLRANDSLEREIIAINQKIKIEDEKFKENFDIIINQSFDSDKEFFSNYLNGFYHYLDSGASKTN